MWLKKSNSEFGYRWTSVLDLSLNSVFSLHIPGQVIEISIPLLIFKMGICKVTAQGYYENKRNIECVAYCSTNIGWLLLMVITAQR